MLVDGSDMSDKNTYLPYLAIPSPLIGRRRATRTRTRTRIHVRSGIKTRVVRMMDNGSQYPFLEETSSCNAREDVGSTEAWERRLVPNHKHWLSHR